MADTAVFEKSLDTNMPDEKFLKKEWVYCLDQQNGNYASGQSILDLSPLSNSGKYVNLSEAFIEVPTILYFSNYQNNNTTALVNSHQIGLPNLMTLKNGSMQILHSMSVEYNGQSVVQLSPFLNVLSHFQTLASWSDLDVKKHGTGLYFVPDDTTSMTYQPAAANNGTGHGICNNINSAATFYPALSTSQTITTPLNRGFFARCAKSGYDLTNGIVPTNGNFPLAGATFTAAQGVCNTIHKDYHTDAGATAATSIKVWHMLLRIRMKDICDLFDSFPMVKNPYLKLTLNFNTAVANYSLSCSTNNAQCSNITQDSATLNGGTMPFMISNLNHAGVSGGANLSKLLLTAGSPYKCVAGCAIGQATVASLTGTTTIKSPFLGGSVRLYAPLYTLTPEARNEYISRPLRSIEYEDFYSFQVTNIASGGTFNQLISNGLTRLKYVLVMPFITSAGAYQNNFTPYQLPFDSAPATTSPIPITNFNVQIGGTNLFMNNMTYDFEMFTSELQSIYALNGAQVNGIVSGLIDETSFQYGHRFYIANCARRVPTEDGIPRSVQIMGTNSSSVAMDLMVFCVFTRELKVDVETSKVA